MLSSDAKEQNLLDILQIDFPDLISYFSVFLSSEMTDHLQIQVDNNESRTKLHGLIRKHIGETIDSVTIPNSMDADASFVKVFLKSSSTSNRRSNQNKRKRKRGERKYLRFCLFKENKETLHAVSILSHSLHLGFKSSKKFAFAGTKDKRGVTSQWITFDAGDSNDCGLPAEIYLLIHLVLTRTRFVQGISQS